MRTPNPRGRGATPTPLPKGFASWHDLYLKWEEYRTSTPYNVKPSRAVQFTQKHNMPLWLVGTVPFLFRMAARDDEAGEYAREIVKKVEAGEIGAPKANNLIRQFIAQNPRFRTRTGQTQAMETLLGRLRDDAELAKNIRNLHESLTDEEVEQFIANITKYIRELSQLKGRFVEFQRNRRKEEQ